MKTGLSFMEATSLVVGAGVGGGVLAVPYLASKAGLPAFLPIVAIASAINILLNLLLVDVLVRDGRDLQIVELMSTYVFRGRIGRLVSWVFFTVLGLSFIASLTAYVSGAGEVLASLTGIATLASQLMVYGFSALIVFLGLKSVGVSEKAAVHLLLLFALVIGFGALGVSNSTVSFPAPVPGRGRAALALYGIVMYSLNAAFAVPQAVKGLARDRRRSNRAVIAGTLINASLVVFLTVVALGVSRPVTEVAVIGIGAATNRVVNISGSLFVFAAMLTTYWSVSLALADMMSQRLGIGFRAGWLAATASTLLLILLRLRGFIDYMQIAGGLVALVVVFITVPMFLRARREHPDDGSRRESRLLASPVVLTVFVCGMVLMAVGSLMGM